MEITISMDMQNKIDMNLDKKKCKDCGGTLIIKRFDKERIYYECAHTGDEYEYVFQSPEEANYYMESVKQELFAKLRKGFIDWQVTDWEQLKKDFDNFIIQHKELENDLQIKMAVIACVTKGFNTMDAEQYRQSKIDFKIVDRMYKARLKELRTQMKSPVLSNSMEDYKISRARYVALRNEYLQTKMMYKLLWSVLKKFFK